jgi:hypothetical protein
MQTATVQAQKTLQVKAAQLRTQDAMMQDVHKQAPHYPGPGSQGSQTHPFAVSKTGLKPFLPTIDAAKYAAYKAKGASTPTGKKNPATQAAVQPLVTTVLVNFEGADQEASDQVSPYPPDTHGAVGLNEFVEVTNSTFDIFGKSNPAVHTTMPLASLFGFYDQPLFDPRVVYDSVWNRWVVTADSFPISSDVQLHFIAVSQTSNPVGPYWIYAVDVTQNSGDFWDFPQLGMNQDAVIITANVFSASGNVNANMFAVAKARLYNGLGFSVPLFTGLTPSLAPPIVLDQNDCAYLIAAPPSGSSLQLYTLCDASTNDIVLTGPCDVSVPAYQMPLPAPQPGCPDLLDTSDSRFVNASTQTGNFLWQVHTIDLVGFATPRYYQIDTSSCSSVQSAFFFASGTSFDFNASIVANSDNAVFVTWSSTDPVNGINVQVRAGGSNGGDFPGPGVPVFTSAICLTADPASPGLQRWGDYSAVTIDPTDASLAWVVNEDVDPESPSAGWSSRIAEVR